MWTKVLVALILLIVLIVLKSELEAERRKRYESEEKLELIKKELAQSQSADAKSIYETYFAPKMEHIQEDFIEGEE